MKMSFAIGDGKALAAPLDYRTLVAGIVGRQSASRTAAAAARLVSAVPAVAAAEALAALILGQSGTDAVLRGSFNPSTAIGLGGKVGSTSVKPAFTFAFQRSFNADDLSGDHAEGPDSGETACSRCQ